MTYTNHPTMPTPIPTSIAGRWNHQATAADCGWKLRGVRRCHATKLRLVSWPSCFLKPMTIVLVLGWKRSVFLWRRRGVWTWGDQQKNTYHVCVYNIKTWAFFRRLRCLKHDHACAMFVESVFVSNDLVESQESEKIGAQPKWQQSKQSSLVWI